MGAQKRTSPATAEGGPSTPLGRPVCNLAKDTTQEGVHAEAGKRMSDCAMSVTFGR